MCCQVCGSILEVREFDYGTSRETGYHDAGETLYCGECHVSRDEGDVIEDGLEAEALREKREAEIGERQWQNRMEDRMETWHEGQGKRR